mmetsp:Transcript_61398/g.150275  ORF Transcript_61398/g.150275 Transcript_61398/m.150275 type:complete len:89 (+) Transcript_61398:67-333(+)
MFLTLQNVTLFKDHFDEHQSHTLKLNASYSCQRRFPEETDTISLSLSPLRIFAHFEYEIFVVRLPERKPTTMQKKVLRAIVDVSTFNR